MWLFVGGGGGVVAVVGGSGDGAFAVAAAVGVGVLGSKFIEAAARQPELSPMLRGQFFLMMGLTDAVPMIGIGLGMYMLFAI